jgi:hypothetical protein
MRLIFFVSNASAGSIEQDELDEEEDVEAEVACGGTSFSQEPGVRVDRSVVPWVDGAE